MSRRLLPFTLAILCLAAAPGVAAAGSLGDLVDDLSGWVDDGLARLREEADRAARRRVRVLERVERLLAREDEDLVRGFGTARRVAELLGRGLDEADPEAVRARELVRELLDELALEYDDVSADARRGAGALADLVPGANHRAGALLESAARLAERAGAAASEAVRARLLERAARLVRRAARKVRRSGGVVAPYACYESETGTAAGVVHLLSGTLGAVSTTHVEGLLAATSRDLVSTLRIDATAGTTTVRLSFPPIAFDGVGAYEIGPAVGQARAEVETAGELTVARSGTISVDAFDLDGKSLSGRFDLEIEAGGGVETLTGVFTLCDILLIR